MFRFWIWFARLKGISLSVKHQLLEEFSDPEELYRAQEKNLEHLPPEVRTALEHKALTEAEQILQQCSQRGIHILTYGDAAYPQRLQNIEDSPLVLYFKGRLPDWNAQPVVGIVGTREASPYGLQTAGLLASQIAACGALVVSGAAFGIDTAAMEGALDAGKPVVGVLGGGVDVVYPARNRALYERTVEKGCLISEYPPGSRPYPSNFLQRNRIISGLSSGVLVVEAPERSGALNTARHAYSQGRDLFVVPGNLGVQTCLGSNALLQEGAYPVLRGWDVVKHYETLYPGVVADRPAPLLKSREQTPIKVAEQPADPEKAGAKKETASKIAIDNTPKSTYSVINKRSVSLNDQEQAIYDLLGPEPELPDSLMDRAALPSGAVQSVLTRLAVKGLVQYLPDGRILRK